MVRGLGSFSGNLCRQYEKVTMSLHFLLTDIAILTRSLFQGYRSSMHNHRWMMQRKQPIRGAIDCACITNAFESYNCFQRLAIAEHER